MNAMQKDLAEIVLSAEQIQRRLDELAEEIQRDFAGGELVLVGVLTGTVLFLADLIRRLTLPLRLDYVGVSSYRGGVCGSRQLRITKSLQLPLRGRNVLVVDDILDTGRTLARVRAMVQRRKPRVLKLCVLLEKDVPRQVDVRADYVGFRIPNQFVVGYGLDYRERYRNLPYVATLRPSVLRRGASSKALRSR